MLLAEIQGKLKGTFGCTVCGNDAISPEADLAIEDALTSSTFGALRWLRPELGLVPILRLLELPVTLSTDPNIRLWPWDRVAVVGIGKSSIAEVGCEPDAVIEVPDQSLALIEVKLGATLGADPLQLPKEAVFAHRYARGRPWRLLCVTTDATPPRIRGFRLEAGHLVLSDRMPLADAVASYFTATAACDPKNSTRWPTAAEVKAAVKWLPWSSLCTLLETVPAKCSTAIHERALLDDVVALLRRRGLVRPVFHGFTLPSPVPALGWGLAALWRRGPRPLWGIRAEVSSWPALSWLSDAFHARSAFQGFGAFSVKRPTLWSKLDWLCRRAGNRRKDQ